MSIHKKGRQMGINPCPLNSFYQEYAATKQQAKDGTRLTIPIGARLTQSQKGEATIWQTTSGDQPASIRLIQSKKVCKQQTIGRKSFYLYWAHASTTTNLKLTKGKQQMGINPCLPDSHSKQRQKTTSGNQPMSITPIKIRYYGYGQ